MHPTMELLLSTVGQDDYSLLDKRNVNCNVIVINQCDRSGRVHFMHDGYEVDWNDMNERGVGKSRNLALLYSSADIILFADDDIDYEDDLESLVIREFERNPSADGFLFNLKSDDKERAPRINSDRKRVNTLSGMHYGAPRLALRRDAVLKARVSFSLLFGGGAKYNSGEDSMFVVDCLRKGLRIFTSPEFIGTVHFDSSSWFKGYDEKYFVDKGASYCSISPRLAVAFCFVFLMRHSDFYEKGQFFKKMSLMMKGVKTFKGNR